MPSPVGRTDLDPRSAYPLDVGSVGGVLRGSVSPTIAGMPTAVRGEGARDEDGEDSDCR